MENEGKLFQFLIMVHFRYCIKTMCWRGRFALWDHPRLQSVGWTNVPVNAMGTTGADSYNKAVNAGKLVTLPDITRCADVFFNPDALEGYKDYR